MEVNNLKKNILINNNEIIPKKEVPPPETRVMEVEQEEFVSSDASLASRAYALNKISNSKKPIQTIEECIKEHRPEMEEDIKKSILSVVNKDNEEFGITLISDDGIKDEAIKEVLETTNAENKYFREQTYKFLKEHREDFGEYYSSATTLILKNTEDPTFQYQLPVFLQKAKNSCKENYSLLLKMVKSFVRNAENADFLLNTFLNNREKFGSDSDESILSHLYDKSHLFTNLLEKFALQTYIQEKNLHGSETLRELIVPIITYDATSNDNLKAMSDRDKISLMNFISKSNFNLNEIKNLKKEGYNIFFEKLQNDSGYDIIFKKEAEKLIDNIKNINPDGEVANLYAKEDVIRLMPDGGVIKSECERFDFGMGEMLERTTTSDGKYTSDSYYKAGLTSKMLTKEIRVVNGKEGPLYIQETTASPIMKGVFDVTVYNLVQTDKNIEDVLEAIRKSEINKGSDILEEIKKAGIKGWNFSKTIENPDGTKSHIEKFQKGELHTKRVYTANDDETKTSLDYTISDTKGKKLLNIHRTFELNGNSSITTLNGKEYKAEFNDEKRSVKIGDVEINFEEKMRGETAENKNILWNLIKKTPGDLILKLEDIESLKYETDNGHWSNQDNRISSEGDLGTLSHEIGHLIDDDFKKSKEKHIISSNKELVKIYNSEMEDFKKNVSEGEAENIKYFSQTGGSSDTGLSELVAEVNMLCSTQRNLELQTRALFVTRYFPKTSAKIAELLGY